MAAGETGRTRGSQTRIQGLYERTVSNLDSQAPSIDARGALLYITIPALCLPLFLLSSYIALGLSPSPRFSTYATLRHRSCTAQPCHLPSLQPASSLRNLPPRLPLLPFCLSLCIYLVVRESNALSFGRMQILRVISSNISLPVVIRIF